MVSSYVFALKTILTNPILSPGTNQCRNLSPFLLLSNCSQTTMPCSASFDFNLHGTKFSCFVIMPRVLPDWESFPGLFSFVIACCVTPSDLKVHFDSAKSVH